MARARVEVRLGVVLWPLVLVPDEEPDRRAERDAVLDAGLQLHKVLFVSLQSVGRGRAFRHAGRKNTGGRGRTGVVRLL